MTITLQRGCKPIVESTYRFDVETTERGTYYELLDDFGGTLAMIRVTNNKISWLFGKIIYLNAIVSKFQELKDLKLTDEVHEMFGK